MLSNGTGSAQKASAVISLSLSWLALQSALGELTTKQLESELAQMQARLDQFPTTLKQDREILNRLHRAGMHCLAHLLVALGGMAVFNLKR